MKLGQKTCRAILTTRSPTWMENDANCAAMAEKLSGNAVKLDDFALITIDSGVGGALFLDAGSAEARIEEKNRFCRFWHLWQCLWYCLCW